MKVKVGDKIYDGEEIPVMVILTAQDKINIMHMLPAAEHYAMFPKDYYKTEAEVLAWMKEEEPILKLVKD